MLDYELVGNVVPDVYTFFPSLGPGNGKPLLDHWNPAMYSGIDYGLGQSNIDTTNGIRYGCISTHSLTSFFWDEVEHDYGPPRCPKCGSHQLLEAEELPEEGEDSEESYKPYRKCSIADHYCPSCKIYFDTEYAYPEEALGWSIDQVNDHDHDDAKQATDIYRVVDCLDSDALILKSAYYTYAPFCSPCVPGAGNLDSVDWTPGEELPDADPTVVRDIASLRGVKTYCFDKSWFEGNKCPYPYWSVETDELVYVPQDWQDKLTDAIDADVKDSQP